MSKAPEPAALFAALGDPTRLAVVRQLAAGVALSATALAQDAAVTRQAIVKHLQVLEAAGLVTHQRQGREVLFTLDARRLDSARAFLDGVSAGRDRALARLQRLVETPSKKRTR